MVMDVEREAVGDVTGDDVRDRSGRKSAGLRGPVLVECTLIGRHELGRPGQAGEANAWNSAAAEIIIRAPVAIGEGLNVLWELVSCGAGHWRGPIASLVKSRRAVRTGASGAF